MPGGIFARAFGGKTDSLEADLKRVTECGVLEIPEELLSAVVGHTHTEEDRREVMRHLRECLAEPSGRRWKRVYAGLILMEHLCKHAAPELLVETAQGRHFDLVQRLSLLETFELLTDKRVQGYIRTRAKALRADVVPRLQTAMEEGCLPAATDGMKDTASTCSPGIASVVSTSTILTAVGSGSPASLNGVAPYEKPAGQMILNGIVAVGHSDDTTSDSDNDTGPRRAVQYRGARKAGSKAGNRPAREASDSDDGLPQACEKEVGGAAKPAPPVTVDLLEL